MDDIQFQIVARMINEMFYLQITSGCDILTEQHYRMFDKIPTRENIRVEIDRAFNHAFDIKLREAFK